MPPDIQLQRGLPADMEQLNGYFLVVENNNAFGIKVGNWRYYFACFAEPARPLRQNFARFTLEVMKDELNANLSAGTISANDSVLDFIELPGQRGYHFKSHLKSDTATKVKWLISGNRSLVSQTIDVPGALPKVNTDTKYIQVQNKDVAYVLKLDTVFGSFDSASVSLINHGGFTFLRAHRDIAPGQTATSIAPKELLSLNSGMSSSLLFQASTFYHYRREGKLVLLEYCKQVSKRVY